jgi:flagellar hook-associated protein 1 FlgK
MAGINNLFELSKRALLAYQGAMNTVGHNVANAQTPGYSRQRVDLRQSGVQEGRWYLGLGVRLEGVERLRDRFLETQILEQTARWGRFSRERALLERLEGLFLPRTEGGLEAAFERFWNAWNDLAAQPDSLAVRGEVREAARALVHLFHSQDRYLQTLGEQALQEARQKVDRVNELLGQIARINQQEHTNRLQGVVDNTLLDERDRLVRELAGLVELTAQTDPRTGMLVLFSGGLALVQGEKAETLEFDADPARATFSLRLRNAQVAFRPAHGELGGLREFLQDTLPELRARLDTLAGELVAAVNTLHMGGFTLDGQTGIAFFDPSGTTAATIELDSAVQGDVSRIAAADRPDEPGNNAVARAIAGLRLQRWLDSGLATPGEFLSSLYGLVGSRSQQARARADAQQAILDHLQTLGEAISGVSLDEEMTHLVRFQQAYGAAARVLQTVQEMVETLLSLK